MSAEYLQLTVYVDQNDTSGDVPLYEAIVRRLLHLGVAGATVQRGVMGYGRHGRVHHQRLLGVSDDRPMTIVAIDESPRLRLAAAEIRKLVKEGVITLHAVERVE